MTKKVLFCILHSLLLVLLSVFLQYTRFTDAEESFFFKWLSFVKYDLLHVGKTARPDNVIFLDVSKDLVLRDVNFPYQGAKEAITDRGKLAALFRLVHRLEGRYRYVLCDVRLDDPSPDDSALAAAMTGLPHVIFPSYFKDGGLVTPIVPVNSGVIEYDVERGNFFKFRVFFQDSFKTLPVKMYEELSGKSFTSKHSLTFLNGRLSFNTVTPDYYFRPKDLVSGVDSVGPAVNLLDLGAVLADSVNFTTYLADKYIVIGNFASDVHSTAIGKIPGPLILFDCFLTLYQRDIHVYIAWLILLFVVYFFINLHLAFEYEVLPKRVYEHLQWKFLKDILKKYLSYLGILAILLLVSYGVFSIWTNILFLAGYLALVRLFFDAYRDAKKNRRRFTFLHLLKYYLK